jgi:signal transduction histidine kinase
MTGQVPGVGLGAALAATAAAGSAAAGIPLQRLGLLVFLLAILLATRWWGRRAGYAALVTSVGIALVLFLASLGTSPVSGVDAAALVLLALLGAGIAEWTGPRPRVLPATEAAPDPRRLKEEFLATVSHELRTPLNAILGWTELLRMPKGVAPQHVDRGLEVIERNARRQLALVEELLAAAEPATPPDAWQPLDLTDLVRTLLASLAPAAAAAGITLDDEAPAGEASPALPSAGVWVRGDASSLRVALRHVLDNAFKFTPAGGRVAARVRQSGDRALVFVSDTGPGIPLAQIDEVFEPFRQQDGSTARAHGGLGLGLTIARKLVERHGGHLDLRSDASGGATLLVTLPAGPPQSQPS